MTMRVTRESTPVVCKFAAVTFVAIWLIAASASGADVVSFQGTTRLASGDLVRLTGKLTKPQGNGPFPAVVLSHGCAGIYKYEDDWAERFAGWGYVALQVDHFGPRGVTELCGRPRQIPFAVRAHDVHDAKAYLGGLPFVDRNRIALMGWSQGGITTLSTVSKANYDSWILGNPPWKQQDSFRAAIAFYPYCNKNLEDTDAPLLILVGELDTWTPAALCRFYMPEGKAPNEIILKIYPNAYHAFDSEGLDEVKVNHRVLSNPEALADSIVRVKDFLAKHLK